MTDPDNPITKPSVAGQTNGEDWQRRVELERALLERLQPSTQFRIPRRKGTGPCAASFAQSRLWYLNQLEPGLPLYQTQSAYRIRGPLDVTALEASVNEIIRRHQVLRTTFIAPEGQPLQVIAPALSVPVTLVDLVGVPDADPHGVQAIAREHVRRPFDLAQGPLLRLTLLRLAPEDHVLLLAMHHIVSDAWSLNILARELSVLYDAFTRGSASPLPELGIQYADFSEWQRSMLQGQLLEDQLHFWKAQLAGAPPAVELPSDRPRPAEPSYSGQRVTQNVPAPLIHSVQTLSAQQQATPFMVLLAAFAVVLQRYTGQDDLVIGTPIANRTHSDLEDLIGFFVNTLAIRLDLSGNPTFRQLLGRVREVALGAYQHQLLPFERLIQELQPRRDPSRAPIVQILFQLLNLPQEGVRLGGLAVEPLPVHSGIVAADLAFSVIAETDTPYVSVDYNTDLFDRATVERLIAHFRTVLDSALARPDERIGYLPLLTPDERQRTLVEWNRPIAPSRSGQAAPAPDLCLHQFFEAQVRRAPAATALISEQRQYTYREVNARANALAHDLISRGIGPDIPVGIFADYCPEAVVGMLAVLKAGGAYVPLNPDHPPERLAFKLRDTSLRCVLTRPETAQRLPPTDIEHLDIDLNGPEPTGEDASDPATAVTPDHLAYIIYTSGSTGVPRGVLVPHRGVCNVIAFDLATQELGPGCRVIQVVSLGFDACARHLMLALASGAASVIVSLETILSPSAMLDAMRENGVTHAPLPTSLLATLPEADLPALRVVNVGAEACPPELVVRWGPGRRFFNVYGPTETSIVATMAECGPDGSKPPIGRPIPYTEAYILDRHLQPLPAGVTGDLYLAGVGLSRGYVNQPALTAERFIPNPFSAKAGARMYRTGDLARYLPDGNIDFVGRSDFQVKIRGFRVEPGEVEAILRRHPAVHEAVVVASQDRPGDVRLAGYAVLHPHATATPADLLEHLRQALPYYMIPWAVVLLESMPLTSSGKVDRRALPPPTDAARSPTPTFVAPRTALEVNIANIWKQVLNVGQVGLQDNFFDLGGHSLLAMRVIALIEKRLGLRISPRDLMFQTLGQLAASGDVRDSIPGSVARQSAQQTEDEGPPGPLGTQSRPPGGIRRAIKRLTGDKS